jgi:hypothetical protein
MRSLAGLVISIVAAALLAGCFHNEAPGAEGHDFLGAAVPKMVVEIDYQNGKELSASTVDLLRTRIGERLNKPGGVTYQQGSIAVSQDTWTIDEIRDAEKANRDHDPRIDTAALYVLVVGGKYERDTTNGRVLGVAYGPSSIAIFKDNIQASGGGLGLPLFSTIDVEKAVLVHEFGHVLGLVNIGLDMVQPHEMTQDPVPETSQNEGRGHSSNKGSVMYWAVESSLVSQIFEGPPPNQFDANDIQDMRAAGGK